MSPVFPSSRPVPAAPYFYHSTTSGAENSRTQIPLHRVTPHGRSLIIIHPRHIPPSQPVNRLRQRLAQSLLLDLPDGVEIGLEGEQNGLGAGETVHDLAFGAHIGLQFNCLVLASAGIYTSRDEGPYTRSISASMGCTFSPSYRWFPEDAKSRSCGWIVHYTRSKFSSPVSKLS